MLAGVTYASAADYERILEIVAEASRGTPEEPLPAGVLERIREFAACNVASFFEGAPWDRTGRRVWTTGGALPVTEEERAVVDTCRLELPLYPSAVTLDRAVRVSDAMSQRRYRSLGIYQGIGRRHRIEYAMDYWMGGRGQPVRGLRFDDSAHDFSDRTRDAIEVLGRHLWTVLARHDRRTAQRMTPLLTDREAEVVALVGRGRTNREIGDALSISPNTVRKHLENAYLNIGVHSRAEAVAWTYRRRPS
jgi:DNA-binding CsgD family transcriptional regulator